MGARSVRRRLREREGIRFFTCAASALLSGGERQVTARRGMLKPIDQFLMAASMSSQVEPWLWQRLFPAPAAVVGRAAETRDPRSCTCRQHPKAPAPRADRRAALATSEGRSPPPVRTRHALPARAAPSQRPAGYLRCSTSPPAHPSSTHSRSSPHPLPSESTTRRPPVSACRSQKRAPPKGVSTGDADLGGSLPLRILRKVIAA